MPNHAPFLEFLGCLNLLKLRVVIETPKRHILGDNASFKPQTVKIRPEVRGATWAELREKKV